jgi:hypothetical protein
LALVAACSLLLALAPLSSQDARADIRQEKIGG